MKVLFYSSFFMIFNLGYTQIILNEVQSSNASTITDNYGDTDDWVEIHNANDFAVEVGGMVLKDKIDTWQIPLGHSETLLPAHGYLLLWADDEEVQGVFHTNFKLSAANGEFLGLYETDSTTVIDSLTIPPLSSDVSYGRDSNGDWFVFDLPTPSKVNTIVDGVTDSIIQSSVSVHPMVTQGKVNITLNHKSTGDTYISLYSLKGVLLKQEIRSSTSFELDLSNLKCGQYLLKMNSTVLNYCSKIIVDH